MLALLGAAFNVSAQTDSALVPVRMAIRTKDYAAAMSRLQPLANNDNADAEYLLVALYRYGLGVAADHATALKWTRSAAAHGNADAAYSLAAMLVNDPGDHRAEIQSLLQQAAQAGHALANRALTTGIMPMHFDPAKSLTDPALRRQVVIAAADQDDVDVLKLFSDGELNAADEFGRSALAHAAQAGAKRAVTYLLQHGCNVNQADAYGVTALMLASRGGHDDIVTQLLNANAGVNVADNAGNNALMYAIACKQWTTARLLLNTNVDVHAANSQHWTALDWAMLVNADEVIATLRARGLTTSRKPSASSEMVTLPLLHAASNDPYHGWPDVVIAASRPSTELLAAAVKQSSVVATAPSGDSALLIAVKSNNAQQVEQLLNAGANVNVTSSMKETP
ncbi:MAG TPA: ankyrin repeat domain-containing protein, partial [Steroidobacteraceae bacterium]|nr:ankyrin repeat domain-containing protein [Steroidobacteraceae bacterium]